MVRPNLHLPPSFIAWLAPYLAAFSRRSRPTTAALAVGALLAVGPRTVTNCLRVLGLAEHPSFTAFHRVLNRNAWSSLALARILLRQVVAAFVPSGPIVIGVDHTLERRRGPRIGPAGRFYDASCRADMPNPTSPRKTSGFSPRPALVECHGAGGRALRRPHLGLAGVDCAHPKQGVV